MVSRYDFLIVGQGIAGTSLAWQLVRLGHNVKVINDPAKPSASAAAAGIFNPLTGKKLSKTWLADLIFPYANKFYKSIENDLKTTFWHSMPIVRPYRSIREQNDYLSQAAHPEFQEYIDAAPFSPSLANFIHMPLGGLKVRQGGWLDVQKFLRKSAHYFASTGILLMQEFNPREITFRNHLAQWQGRQFSKIIFCTGALEDPFFKWLPFTPVKGEILEIAMEDFPVDAIINQGIYILPKGATSIVGATYAWENLDWQVTASARQQLEEKLKILLRRPYQVIDQRAGIRPAVRDRRPLLGNHPRFPSLAIFNGLGTKGVTLAPYFSLLMARQLANREVLPAEVNIQRFNSLYFQ